MIHVLRIAALLSLVGCGLWGEDHGKGRHGKNGQRSAQAAGQKGQKAGPRAGQKGAAQKPDAGDVAPMPSPAATTQGKDAPRLVMLAVMDTVRADHTSLCGYERPTTPRLDKLSTKATAKSCEAYSPAPWTHPSHASMFTGKPVTEQLREILKRNSVMLIDLFREWDDDGNGALDKKEWRKGFATLGYDAPQKDVDAIFDSINEDGNGFVEFSELKVALSGKRIRAKAAEAKAKEKRASLGGKKGQGSLDFDEFCILVRGREEGDIPVEELKARFEALAPTADGMVTMAQYLTWSLKDGLMRSSQRLVDLFRAWDEDGNGKVDGRNNVWHTIWSSTWPNDN